MKIAVVGAGGHAKVVIDSLKHMDSMASPMMSACLIDPEKADKTILGMPVFHSVANLKPSLFIVAIGDNRRRQKCFDEMLELGWQPINAVHPSAVISRQASIGRGVFIGANAVINSDSKIGDNVIVNTAAVIEHDCQVGAHSHIAPRSVMGGGVKVGDGALVGIGSIICPHASVGDWSILGAGAVLLHQLDGQSTAVGVPARVKTRT